MRIGAEAVATNAQWIEMADLIAALVPKASARPVKIDEGLYRALRTGEHEDPSRSGERTLCSLLSDLERREGLERGGYRLLGLTHGSRAFNGYVVVTWQKGSAEAEICFFRPWLRIPARLLSWMARNLGWCPNVPYTCLAWRLRALRLFGWRQAAGGSLPSTF